MGKFGSRLKNMIKLFGDLSLGMLKQIIGQNNVLNLSFVVVYNSPKYLYLTLRSVNQIFQSTLKNSLPLGTIHSKFHSKLQLNFRTTQKASKSLCFRQLTQQPKDESLGQQGN